MCIRDSVYFICYLGFTVLHICLFLEPTIVTASASFDEIVHITCKICLFLQGWSQIGFHHADVDGEIARSWLPSVLTSGVAIQVASGAYSPPVSKIHNIFGM